MDETDVYSTFTHEEARRLGIVPASPVIGNVRPGGESTPENLKTPDHKPEDGLS